MYSSKAFIPTRINHFPSQAMASIASILLGLGMLSLLAQLKITLPWTPVPITGQTFGVALLALLWGSRLSFITFAIYLVAGFLGAPIFASGLSGILIGPTFGYLIGMLFASWIIGKLSDNGQNNSFKKAFFACFLGSVVVFSCGVIGLSFFIPTNRLFITGVLPFLPGDLLKNILAASLAIRINKN